MLSGLALAQTLLIVMMIRMGFESPNPKLISWNMGLLITNFLTLFTSFNLGLLISAIVKNSSQANNTLPLLILPQIIFSGVLFKTESVVSKILSWLMISRWSVGAYGTILNINSLIPAPTKLSDGKIIYPPFKATSVYDPTWENLGLNWGMLLLHAMVYLLITFILQKRKDIFK
nr:ABC transporter permease [Aphanizomenon flos-aquae]